MRYLIKREGQDVAAFVNPSDAMYYVESMYKRDGGKCELFDTEDEDLEAFLVFSGPSKLH